MTRVGIYRASGEWCYAAFRGKEFDCSDTLDVSVSAEEPEARAEALRLFPGADIRRVEDIS